jgi:hypothetical protein
MSGVESKMSGVETANPLIVKGVRGVRAENPSIGIFQKRNFLP